MEDINMKNLYKCQKAYWKAFLSETSPHQILKDADWVSSNQNTPSCKPSLQISKYPHKVLL